MSSNIQNLWWAKGLPNPNLGRRKPDSERYKQTYDNYYRKWRENPLNRASQKASIKRNRHRMIYTYGCGYNKACKIRREEDPKRVLLDPPEGCLTGYQREIAKSAGKEIPEVEIPGEDAAAKKRRQLREGVQRYQDKLIYTYRTSAVQAARIRKAENPKRPLLDPRDV